MKWQQVRNVRAFQENVRCEDGFSLRAYAIGWGAQEVNAAGHDEENEQKMLLAVAALIQRDHTVADVLIAVIGSKSREEIVAWAQEFIGRDFQGGVSRR